MTEADSPPRAHRPFLPSTTMAEAVAADPNVTVVLMSFHIGGCSLCGFQPEDTIAQVAEDNGVPLERLLEALNAGTC
jgi:hypothetical protein